MSLKKFFLVVLTFIVSFPLTTLPALADFSGMMNVNVCNQSGTDINVQVTHQWTKASLDPVFPANTGETLVSNNKCSAGKQIQVGSGGSDQWSVVGAYVGGQIFAREGKQCNVTEGDFDSGNPIYFTIFSYNQGFSVELPESSSCLHNSFN